MLCGEKNGNGFITENGSTHFGISVCPFCCLYVSAVLFSVDLKGFRTRQDEAEGKSGKCTLAWCDAVLCAGRTLSGDA